MGRAYEVRKVSIQKTGAAKAKLYSMYAREIYSLAKSGGTEIDSNLSLKRLIEKAKKEQVPGDIIKRAIDKVSSGVDENYEHVKYEIFGNGGSTLLVECLTDNLNRSVSSIRAALNKCKSKMGSMGSVSFNYDHVCIVSFKSQDEEGVFNALLEADLDDFDIELEEDSIVIYGRPQDINKIKETIETLIKDVEFDMDDIVFLPKEKVTLNEEDRELFDRLTNMLDDIEDVQNVYHNVID